LLELQTFDGQPHWNSREIGILLRNALVAAWHAVCDASSWVPDHVSFTPHSRRGRDRTAGERRRVRPLVYAWVAIAASGLSEYFDRRCNSCG